jgi:peptide deformylase
MFGDPVLRQRAPEITKIDEATRRLAADMIDTMREARGAGLAGPQVGVMQRIFVWEVGDRHGVVVNPRIVRRSDETFTDEEGCLSIPGLYYPVERSYEVTVEGLDLNGDEMSLTGRELLARCLQHEIDHLDGVLFIDRLPGDLRRDAMRMLREQSLGLASFNPSAGEPL